MPLCECIAMLSLLSLLYIVEIRSHRLQGDRFEGPPGRPDAGEGVRTTRGSSGGRPNRNAGSPSLRVKVIIVIGQAHFHHVQPASGAPFADVDPEIDGPHQPLDPTLGFAF